MTEQVTAATDGDILALRNELDTVSAGEILSLVARIDADRAKIAAMRDGMKGAVRIKPLVWEEDLADPRLLGEGCCYYVADGTLWFFDPSIHRIKAKLGVQVHLEGRTISDAAQADYEARLIASGVVEPVEVPR